MKRLVTALLAGAAVSTVAFASAATLNVDGGVLQAGQDGQLYCDVDGVKVNWGLETDDNRVHFVDVTGIDEECFGADLALKVNNGAKTFATTIDSSTERIAFAEGQRPSATDLESVQVWIGK